MPEKIPAGTPAEERELQGVRVARQGERDVPSDDLHIPMCGVVAQQDAETAIRPGHSPG